MRWPWSKAPETRTVTVPPEVKLSFNEFIERLASAQMAVGNITVSPSTAMRCGAVFGVVRAFTNAISSYPVRVEQWVDENGRTTKKRLPDHSLAPRLRQPNKVQTSAEFFSMAIKHVALYGDFFAVKGAGSSGPIGWLRPVESPDAVTLKTPVRWDKGAEWQVNFDSGARDYGPGKLLHFTNGIIAADGVTGLSPVSEMKNTIAICMTAETMLAGLYGNNNVPPYVITGDSTFADEATYNAWMSSFQKLLKEAQSEGIGSFMLPPGMKINELAFKPFDALLIDVIKQKSREIFAGFGVPPHKLADLERATFSNIEEQDTEFVRDVMEPHVERFAQAMNRDLLTDDDVRKGIRVRFDTEQATQGRFKDRVEAYAKGFQVGAYSSNDIRAKLGENPREGGDEYFVQVNMGGSDERAGTPGKPDSGEPPADE